MTPRVTRYTIGRYDRVTGERPIDIEETNAEKGTWAIRRGAAVLAKDYQWEVEEIPSNRDETFYARCRWRLDEALEAASKAHDMMLESLRQEALQKLQATLAKPEPTARRNAKFQPQRHEFDKNPGEDP